MRNIPSVKLALEVNPDLRDWQTTDEWPQCYLTEANTFPSGNISRQAGFLPVGGDCRRVCNPCVICDCRWFGESITAIFLPRALLTLNRFHLLDTMDFYERCGQLLAVSDGGELVTRWLKVGETGRNRVH